MHDCGNFEALKRFNDEAKRSEQRLARFAAGSAARRKKQLFSVLKQDHERRKEKNSSTTSLADIFLKTNLRRQAQIQLRAWVNSTFKNVNSNFHKGVAAKDQYRASLKQKLFGTLLRSFRAKKSFLTVVCAKCEAVRLKLGRLALQKIFTTQIESQERQRIQELSRCFREWREVVVRGLDERQLELLNEINEKESQQHRHLEVKKERNQRFINRLLGIQAVGGGEEQSHLNATEFSSELDNADDKEIKSAM